MTNVHGIQPTLPSKPIESIDPAGAVNGIAPTKQMSDTVELSPVAQLAAKVSEIPDVRAELVGRVKAELAAGAYETPDKIEIAVQRLMQDLLGEM